MQAQQIMRKLSEKAYQEENISLPYPIAEGATRGIAAFTFWADEDEESEVTVVDEIDQELRFLNGRISCRKLPELEQEIRITDAVYLQEEEYERLNRDYYLALDAYLDTGNIQGVKDTFRKFISPEAMELYRLVCPEFVRTLL